MRHKCLSVALVMTAAALSAAALELEITVDDNANTRQVLGPVCGGVPFPRGKLKDADLGRLSMTDPEGKPVANVQGIAIGHWSDGSVKWLLLDFPANIKAAGRRTYTLKLGGARPARSAISVTGGGNSYTVDTGAMKATVSASRLFERVWVDADGSGSYSADEAVVSSPGSVFLDLDDSPPGAADGGINSYGGKVFRGMEGGNWLRESKSATSKRYEFAGDGISVFRNGPQHVVLKITGWYVSAGGGRKFGKTSMYVHFYSNQSYVRVSHTWTMTGDPQKDFVRRMGISVPVAASVGDELGFAFGGERASGEAPRLSDRPVGERKATGGRKWQPLGGAKVYSGKVARSGEAYLLSIGPDKYYHYIAPAKVPLVDYTVHAGGAQLGKGFEAAGWGDVSGLKVGMAAGVQDFHLEHPKEVQFKNGRLTVYLWPDHGNMALDLRRRFPKPRGHTNTHGRSARRCFNRPGIAVGVAKTTDCFFYFHGGDWRSGRVDETFRALDYPLRPFAGAKWNTDTLALGVMGPYDPVNWRRTENAVELAFEWMLRNQDVFQWCGWIDHGDAGLEYEAMRWELKFWPADDRMWNFWGYTGWSHTRDCGQYLLLQYYRTGKYRYWWKGDRWARHHRDVDVIHWDKPDNGPRPGDNGGRPRLGGGRRHDQQHWGTYTAGYGQPAITTGHHYYLSGEGRDLECYEDMATYHLKNSWSENEARPTLMYMGEVLGKPEYFEAGVQKALAHQGVDPDKSAYGRNCSLAGQAVMLADIQTNGAPRNRKLLQEWSRMRVGDAHARIMCFARMKQAGAGGGGGGMDSKIRRVYDMLFPAKGISRPVRARSLRHALGHDKLPQGVRGITLRYHDTQLYQFPSSIANMPNRAYMTAQLVYAMPSMGVEPEGKTTDTAPPSSAIKPAGGSFRGGVTFHIDCTETADVFFTLDGSDPKSASANGAARVYRGPLTLRDSMSTETGSVTVKFRARDEYGNWEARTNSAAFSLPRATEATVPRQFDAVGSAPARPPGRTRRRPRDLPRKVERPARTGRPGNGDAPARPVKRKPVPNERKARTHFNLAENFFNKDDADNAALHYRKVIELVPGSRLAERARDRLEVIE